MTDADLPQPGALLSLADAKRERCCRICGEVIAAHGVPVEAANDFREMVYPVAVTFNFGDEFAHTDCLKEQNA